MLILAVAGHPYDPSGVAVAHAPLPKRRGIICAGEQRVNGGPGSCGPYRDGNVTLRKRYLDGRHRAMLQGMPVVFLERLATDAGLAPQERAIKLPAGWTIVDHPLDSLSGGPGGPGQVTGYLKLVPPALPALGSGYTLGDQDPPQYVAAVSSTVTLSSGTQVVGTVQVGAGKVVTFDLSVNAKIILPVPGILLPGAFEVFVECAAYGSSGAIVLGEGVDAGRSNTTSPWIPTAVDLAPSGNTVQILAQAYTVPPFVSGHAYGGSLAGSTTVPNAVGNPACALVTNDTPSRIYVCTSGGTDSSSAGPTGTGPGVITVGGLDYYYVGPAASGVPCSVTVTLNGIKTG